MFPSFFPFPRQICATVETKHKLAFHYVCTSSSRQNEAQFIPVAEAYRGSAVKLHAFWTAVWTHALVQHRQAAGCCDCWRSEFVLPLQLIHWFLSFCLEMSNAAEIFVFTAREDRIIYFDYQYITFQLLYTSELWVYVVRRCAVLRILQVLQLMAVITVLLTSSFVRSTFTLILGQESWQLDLTAEWKVVFTYTNLMWKYL